MGYSILKSRLGPRTNGNYHNIVPVTDTGIFMTVRVRGLGIRGRGSKGSGRC